MELLFESDTEKCTERCIRSADALRVGPRGLAGSRQGFGAAPSAASRSHREHTTLTSKKCTAEILISTKSKRIASSMKDALAPDLSMLSGEGEHAEIRLKGSKIFIKFETGEVASLRANLNSALLLASATYRCLTL